MIAIPFSLNILCNYMFTVSFLRREFPEFYDYSIKKTLNLDLVITYDSKSKLCFIEPHSNVRSKANPVFLYNKLPLNMDKCSSEDPSYSIFLAGLIATANKNRF